MQLMITVCLNRIDLNLEHTSIRMEKTVYGQESKKHNQKTNNDEIN